MKLTQGTTYQCELDLPWFVSKSMAIRKLEDFGFIDVTIYTAKGKTIARGTWPGLSQEIELPTQVSNIIIVK